MLVGCRTSSNFCMNQILYSPSRPLIYEGLGLCHCSFEVWVIKFACLGNTDQYNVVLLNGTQKAQNWHC